MVYLRCQFLFVKRLPNIKGNLSIYLRYHRKVSTGTDGKIFYLATQAVQNISPDDEVCIITFYTEGGNAQITCTWRGGITYIREGIGVSLEAKVPVDNPTFQCTLDAGTTLYYYSDEVD